MKKILCFFLTAVLLLSLCACSGSEVTEKKGLQVGFCRADATPTEAVNISGGDSKNRMSAGYRDPITVTCVALSNGGETYLMYTLDYISASNAYTVPAESLITEATGIPAERIIMNCTHTHSGPAIGYDYDTIKPYRDKFNKAAVEAAEKAIADMSSAELYAGSVETEGLVFVRHYEMDNGTFAGANYGSFSTSIKGHAYEGDASVQVIKFARSAEDKKDVILVSNPAHATAVSGTDSSLLSADIAYSVRDSVEKSTDSHVAYFIGAAGDQVPSSRIPAEGSTNDYLLYGERMGNYITELIPNLTKLEAGPVELETREFTGKTIKEGLERLADARAVREVATKYGNGAPETKAAVAQYNFSSVYQATAIVARNGREDTQTMTLNAMGLGELGIIFAPYEMFSENGKFVKENSPYALTFVVTCSENAQGYLPSANGFRVECYESHVTTYERGTAENLADTFVEMLNKLKAE
ncbi:MAG: hypothetical protein IKU07_03625 [Oscillospiraceae bacterium]|nr:hypothetical protein [Oscillospiraceae bacterium]